MTNQPVQPSLEDDRKDKIAEELREIAKGLLPYAAKHLTDAADHIDELYARLSELSGENVVKVLAEDAELKRHLPHLKSKTSSPEICTMPICSDCGEATRNSRHLDIDCETIQRLKADKAELERKLEAAEEEREGLLAFKRSVDEALNSGDGAYRP